MLNSNLSEVQNGFLEIKDMSADVVQEFLAFINDDDRFSPKNSAVVVALLIAADKYMMQELKVRLCLSVF
jgi:hypothetical protein